MINEMSDIIDLIVGSMSEVEFDRKYPTKYVMTERDIEEIQNNADRELF